MKSIKQIRQPDYRIIAGTQNGYHMIEDSNGKRYSNVGAIKFRDKVYYGKSDIAIHPDALAELMKVYPISVIEDELSEKNFGYYWRDGPLTGQFTQDTEGYSDQGRHWTDDKKKDYVGRIKRKEVHFR